METSNRSTTPGGTHVRTHRHLRARHDALRRHAVQALRRQRLKLPAISLGFWHNFGDITPYDQMKAWCSPHSTTASRTSTWPTTTAPNPAPRRRTRDADPAIPRRPPRRTGHQHQGRLRDVVGPYGDWGSRKIPARLTRPEPGTPGTRLRRHLLPSPSGPRDPSGGNDGRARPGRRQRQGALCGLSNYDGPQLERAATILDELHVPFIINQNKYNIFDRTVERNGLKDTAKHLARVSSRSARSRRVC